MLKISVLVLVTFMFVASNASSSSDLGDWQWDWGTAYRYVWYADVAGCCNETVGIPTGNWNCPYCKHYPPAASFEPLMVYYDEKEESYGFLGVNTKYQEIALVFRGSKVTLNFLEDLESMVKVDYPYAERGQGGRVGSGFLGYWQSLRPAFLHKLATLVDPVLCKMYPPHTCPYAGYTIAVIGHSLGGACAALAGVDVAKAHQQTNKVVVYTYGEPRVGDKQWVHYQHTIMQGDIYRITNNRDLVPHLPPRIPHPVGVFKSFQHELREVWERPDKRYPLQRDQNYTICSALNPEDEKCSDSIKLFFSIKEHNEYMGVPCCAGPDAKSDEILPELNEAEKEIVKPYLTKLMNEDGDGNEMKKAIAAVQAYRKKSEL